MIEATLQSMHVCNGRQMGLPVTLALRFALQQSSNVQTAGLAKLAFTARGSSCSSDHTIV